MKLALGKVSMEVPEGFRALGSEEPLSVVAVVGFVVVMVGVVVRVAAMALACGAGMGAAATSAASPTSRAMCSLIVSVCLCGHASMGQTVVYEDRVCGDAA